MREPHHDAPDRDLVRSSLEGDATAFAALHRRYYATVFRLALFRTKSVADAEDIAGETFVRAIDHLPTYRFTGESILPWLARIAANLATDQLRRRGTVPMLSYDQKTADDVRSLLESLESAHGIDPHDLAERSETQALLREALATLPHDQADAILLRFGGDLSLLEIAQAMGRSEGAIKSLIHRGLVNLRKTLLREAERSGEIARLSARLAERTSAASPEHTTKRHGHIEL